MLLEITLLHIKDGYGEYNEVIFEPATKIEPTLNSRLKLSEKNTAVVYEYRLKNEKGAKQNIATLLTTVSNVNSGSPFAPPRWDGRVVPSFTDSSLRLSWTYGGEDQLGGLSPEKALSGFEVESNDLPGIANMEIKGASQPTTWPGHTPGVDTKVGKQMYELKTKKDFVPRLAAVPRIPVPTPWDTGTVLANIRTHLNTDIVPMQLVDPVFANELNRLFTAAIEAAKHNNDKGIKENLKDIRKALKKAHRDMDADDEDNHAHKHRHGNKNESDDWEHTDPKQKPKPVFIDKLAARVLDFDVKYVLGRLGKD